VSLLISRASQRGGPVKLSSCQAFAKALATAESRIDAVIGSKLESFFELAEYNWMPTRPQSTSQDPSTYVFEMITFLTAYVDSVLIGLNEDIKTRAYKSALGKINAWLMVSTMTNSLIYRTHCVERWFPNSTRLLWLVSWRMSSSSKQR
jgi:hypothetical protein